MDVITQHCWDSAATFVGAEYVRICPRGMFPAFSRKLFWAFAKYSPENSLEKSRKQSNMLLSVQPILSGVARRHRAPLWGLRAFSRKLPIISPGLVLSKHSCEQLPGAS